jgi:hypothetical protein
MKLVSNAVGTLQTVIECPTCGKTGEETMFTECCCKYVLGLLGIHSIQRNSECPLCGLALRSDEDETGCFQGYCRTYAVFLPYRAAFTNGANWECQHHRLDGRCAA